MRQITSNDWATAASWVATTSARCRGFRPSDKRRDRGVSGCLIELSGWFVGEQKAGVGRHGPGKCDPLRLSAGEFVREACRRGQSARIFRARPPPSTRAMEALPSRKSGNATFSTTLRNGTRLGA